MSVLVIAPHADDETLGMGGTIARLAGEGKHVTVAVMTGPGDGPHPIWPNESWNVVRAEAEDACALLGVRDLIFENLPAACLTDIPVHAVNRTVSSVIRRVDPEELYLPFYHDLHQDHAALAYAGIVHARPYLAAGRKIRLMAMYETPTETHLFPAQLQPAFVPTMWVDVTATLERKIEAWARYRSQHQAGPTPRSPESLRALATVRGGEIGAAAAEAFVLLRVTR